MYKVFLKHAYIVSKYVFTEPIFRAVGGTLLNDSKNETIEWIRGDGMYETKTVV